MPKENVTRRRHVLLVDVTQAASEVSRLVHEARDLNLPWSRASAKAATPWSAGPCSWRNCCPNPRARPAGAGCTAAAAGKPRGPLACRQPRLAQPCLVRPALSC